VNEGAAYPVDLDDYASVIFFKYAYDWLCEFLTETKPKTKPTQKMK
jgi:hypothetical protein